MRKEFRYGRKIQQAREARAWTQEQLAIAADVEPRTIQRGEKGLTKNPETLQAIAGAFDVNLESLRETWLVPESRLVRTWLVTSHQQFVDVQQAHPWQQCSRMTATPLTDEGQRQINELLKRIFADCDLIEPYETELWECYVEQIQEPLEALFDLGQAIFLLDEQRDLILPGNGAIKPTKSHIDNWRVRHFLVVPRHGCFQINATEPLHRFHDGCHAAGNTLFRVLKEETGGALVYANALVAVIEKGRESGLRWCETCFPHAFRFPVLSTDSSRQLPSCVAIDDNAVACDCDRIAKRSIATVR
jgi:transcriptional regulator with XRE-family HTH domain